MNHAQLSRIIHDPRGPEEVIPGLSEGELAALLDGLYRNLDTPTPDLGAEFWYELCVEESTRRGSSTVP
jgi:hypothetical protein